MKRSYPANIDGQIFYIDEDAFLLLQNYLEQLKLSFPGDEGREIVSDIEGRIREHFNEKSGESVIVLADVNKVIETMGRPEELCDGSQQPDKNVKESEQGFAVNIDLQTPTTRKHLYRNLRNKVFGGVVGGLATFLGWNANIMRLLLIVLVIATTGILHMWPFMLAYLIAWMIIPAAVTPRQILQMKGEDVTIDAVGQTVIENSGVTPPPIDGDGSGIGHAFSTVMSIIGKCIMGFIGFISGAVCFGALVGALCILIGMFAWWIAGNNVILSQFDLGVMLNNNAWWVQTLGVFFGILFATMVFGAIAWGCGRALFVVKPASRAWTISLTIMAMIFLALAVSFSLIAAA